MKVVDTNDLFKKDMVPEVDKKTAFNTLYSILPKVFEMSDDKILNSSKYVRLAKIHKYDNYRFCRYNDIVKSGLVNHMTYYQKHFVSNDGAVLAMFNTLGGKPVSVVFRSLSGKNFMDYSVIYCAYGLDLMSPDFKYGDPVILTEGIYDADTIRPVYKNVVAVLTSNITVHQANILNSLTNNFIVAFDQDSAGISGYNKAMQRLNGNVQILSIFENDKDLGVMEEVRDSKIDFNERLEYYTKSVSDLLSTGTFSII